MIDASLLMGLVVFLLAMGWYPCCCETGIGCEDRCLSSSPTSITVTIDGVTAGTDFWNACTNCVSLANTSFVLQRQSDSGILSCAYLSDMIDDWNCPFAYGIYRYLFAQAHITRFLNGHYGWEVQIRSWNPSNSSYTTFAIYQWDSGFEAAFDCSADRTIPNVSTYYGTASCNFTASTCELTV